MKRNSLKEQMRNGEFIMNELQRHKMVFKILIPVISIFLKCRFNYRYEDISKVKGPYLLLANHNLELDPAFVGMAARNQLYFVASEHILRKGIGTWLLMTFFKPIIHKKGKQGMNTIKEMLKTLKEGHSVCIFPEGNRSFNGLTGEILPSIGKVARRSGAGLVTYRVEGGYFTQPRWSTTLRRGKMQGKLIKVYSPEELKEMTDAQVGEAICNDLYEDAYATQQKERVPFKGKNLALGMESTLFACPSCKMLGNLHSDKNHLFCDCGFRMKYDVFGDLTDAQGAKYTITELDAMQRELLKEQFEAYIQKENAEDAFFTDQVTVYNIDGSHRQQGTLEGTLKAYGDRLELCGRKIPYEEITGAAIYSRNSMILHQKGIEGHVEIKSHMAFNALKYQYLLQMKGILL